MCHVSVCEETKNRSLDEEDKYSQLMFDVNNLIFVFRVLFRNRAACSRRFKCDTKIIIETSIVVDVFLCRFFFISHFVFFVTHRRCALPLMQTSCR